MKSNSFAQGALGFALWGLLMLALVFMQNWVNLANGPVLLILISSIYSLLLPLALSLLLSGIAVLMFNYQHVPPIGTFRVDMGEHGALLVTIMGVSGLITYLLRRQQQIVDQKQEQAARTLQLMHWSENLRAQEDPRVLLPTLQGLVQDLVGDGSKVFMGFEEAEIPIPSKLNETQREGFQECLRENRLLGNGTGRFDDLEDLYLPMRGRYKAHGACLCVGGMSGGTPPWVPDAQALLDQMGLACERRENFLRAQRDRELAHQQKVRSLFLTSIAHDQRTPLASIMTSASAIVEQLHQLSKDEIRRYAELINSESQQVARLTDNTLTLARLSNGQVQVPMQLESAQDMVASVCQRLRKRGEFNLPQVQVQPELPLIHCNMVLVEQVLDNLIDNAVKHSGAPRTVSLNVFLAEGGLLFEVSDRGKGLSSASSPDGDQFRGLGIGLQLCHMVASVHHGSMVFSSAPNAGCVARFQLPLAH